MKTFTQVLNEHPLDIVAKNLIIIGALVWLCVGLLNTNYVDLYAGSYAKYIYILVGLAGVYCLYKEVMWATMPPTTVTSDSKA